MPPFADRAGLTADRHHEEAAEAVLRIFRLDQSDQDRMHDLLVKNQEDALTPAETEELESYLRISLMVL